MTGGAAGDWKAGNSRKSDVADESHSFSREGKEPSLTSAAEV